MTNTGTDTRTITAAGLRPGDIVLCADGTRWFAAFDVSTPAGPGDGDVRVWTAITDQDNGMPATLDIFPTCPLTVSRRDDDPAVTHTTVAVPYDDRPFPYTAR
jgi:hypothetical protein